MSNKYLFYMKIYFKLNFKISNFTAVKEWITNNDINSKNFFHEENHK